MWTKDQVEHLNRFSNPERGEIYRHLHRVTVENTDWICAFNGSILMAFVAEKFTEDLSHIHPINGFPGSDVIQNVMNSRWGFNHEAEIDVLKEWAGDPFAGPRPGILHKIVIDRRLLARTLITLPGPTVVLGSGSVSNGNVPIEYVTVRGPGWRVLIVSWMMPDPSGLPEFGQ
jgi:hypothetical protein